MCRQAHFDIHFSFPGSTLPENGAQFGSMVSHYFTHGDAYWGDLPELSNAVSARHRSQERQARCLWRMSSDLGSQDA